MIDLYFSEEDVKAACFYVGVAKDAKKKGISTKEYFFIQYGELYSAVKYDQIAKMFSAGEDATKAGATLLLSPRFNAGSNKSEIDNWRALIESQARSPVVKMSLPEAYKILDIRGEANRISGSSFFLAGLVL